jgi:hypothetical protein
MNGKLKQIISTVVFVLLIGFTTIVVIQTQFNSQTEKKPDDVQTVEIIQESSYILLPTEQMIDESNAIVAGKVIKISPTQWNQDSGEFWEGDLANEQFPLQLHYIELEIIKPIVDGIGLDSLVKITVLRSSPLDGTSEHNLKEGDQIVVFLADRELVWQGGMRKVVRLTNAPAYSYYVLDKDGLYHGLLLEMPLSFEQVVAQIAERRETLVQP